MLKFREAQMEWKQAEWSEKAETVADYGLQLVVETDDEKEWTWMVELDSSRSEVPEVWDAGISLSLKQAKRAARGSANKALLVLKPVPPKLPEVELPSLADLPVGPGAVEPTEQQKADAELVAQEL